VTAALVVLASGSGTNLQAIIDACSSGRLDARVVHVITNRRDAVALQRAASAGISSDCVPLGEFESELDDRAGIRRAYDTELASMVASHDADLVVLAGWMHLLSGAFLDDFPGRVVNLHPALPGTFPGAHAIDDAWAAHVETGLDHTGVMVHLVPDEGVDSGPVVLSERVDILDTDTRESLESRIHAVEHRLFVDAIDLLIRTTE